MTSKQELIDLILPVLKNKLVGNKHPYDKRRIITDVRITIEDKSEYFEGQCEYDEGYYFEYTDFKIEVETKTPKGKIKSWDKLYL